MIDKRKISSGGLRNDCKQNYTYPVGFPKALWDEEEAGALLQEVRRHLRPAFEHQEKIAVYQKRARTLGVELLQVQQAHVGTDKAPALIKTLLASLRGLGVEIALETEMTALEYDQRQIVLGGGERIGFTHLILAPGRAGFRWLQQIMTHLGVAYRDNIVDIGIRVETRLERYPIVADYYDPKFLFPGRVRTFCTNSGSAYVAKEKYAHYYSVNGHSLSAERAPNGLVNFAMLKTITLTEPVASGSQFAQILGEMAMQLGGGNPLMQRVGDFRMGKRSRRSSFNNDLYDFVPTLGSATPGDISLAVPAKIMRDIWSALKMLDTIVPGVLHPSTILYYPEIKTYANRPEFDGDGFRIKPGLYVIGDGAGTSRGITAAWASGIRAASAIAAARC
jgi:uncharacterized FAD-dependent dehydrogenase